ncbi:MAG: hypothetical protein D8M59_01650 [Planctomycetes bacterium]|nr:hypothetical protein [Planctomycetota bacterium]NOG54575.1 hypothetical protein [Planctomycetota bacterium]
MSHKDATTNFDSDQPTPADEHSRQSEGTDTGPKAAAVTAANSSTRSWRAGQDTAVMPNREAQGVAQPDDYDDLDADELMSPSLELTRLSAIPNGQMMPAKLKGWARIEAFIENLIHTNRFFHKIGSRIWLPLAFHSGLTMKKLDPHSFTAVLPFRRFNRNWYNAMAGAALVANSEIAAGMYLCAELGGKWTVVCRNLSYRFLRPCFGPAIYRVTPIDGLKEIIESGLEFNLDMAIDILQHVKNHGRQPRVGRCVLTFHCTPKDEHGNKRMFKRSGHRRRR